MVLFFPWHACWCVIMINLPEVINAKPSAVTKRIEDISWVSTPKKSGVLSGCLDITLMSLPTTPPLAPLSTKESDEERLTFDKQ